MFENMTEQNAREQILGLVEEYCDTYHRKKEYYEGDRIPYASRVYDKEEMLRHMIKTIKKAFEIQE